MNPHTLRPVHRVTVEINDIFEYLRFVEYDLNNELNYTSYQITLLPFVSTLHGTNHGEINEEQIDNQYS